MLRDNLLQLLIGVQARAGSSFAGTGVLVCSDPSTLNIASLRPMRAVSGFGSALDRLVEMSDPASEFHDGFHVLSPDLNILLVSQYFSPPVVPDVVVDPSRRLGGRYMAGLFGSALPTVHATGVASSSYGVAIFEGGREVGTRL